MMDALENLIRTLSPRWGLRRELARYKTRVVERLTAKFDAASRSKRNRGWEASNLSPNEENLTGLDKLRARRRELTRNNEYASASLNAWTRNANGEGPRPHFMGEEDEVRRANELWKRWAGSKLCDAAGRHKFGGLARLAMRSTVEAGEALVRRRWRRQSAGLEVPLQLQLLEPDHLDTDKRPDDERARIVQGVQFSLRGVTQGYWVFPEHPGDRLYLLDRTESVFVPASELIHVMRPERIGQVRGIPWGHAAMQGLRDVGVFYDATVQRQVVSQMLMAFIRDLSADELTIPTGKAETEGAESDDPMDAIEPAAIWPLPLGKTVEFSDPPQPVGIRDYSDVALHQAAAGEGVPYEEMTGDMSRGNFASSRLGRLPFGASIREFRVHDFVPTFCEGIMDWFWDAVVDVAGLLPRRLETTWTFPPPLMADPQTEIEAAVRRVRAGFSSLSQEIRGFGMEPEEVLEELAGDYELLDSLGLVLDVDGRKVTAAGAPVQEQSEEAEEPEDELDDEDEDLEDDEQASDRAAALAGANGSSRP